jgi:hypothetical protein
VTVQSAAGLLNAALASNRADLIDRTLVQVGVLSASECVCRYFDVCASYSCCSATASTAASRAP